MALDGTSAGLNASIAGWLDRTDLTAVIPDFVTVFESNANTDPAFRSQFNRTSAAYSTIASTNSVVTPTDLLTLETVTVTYNNQTYVLVNYGTATALYTQFPTATLNTGIPKGFIVLNGKIELANVPDAVYTGSFYYYQKIPPLAANPSGNWLLTNYPQIYLLGSLLAAEAYLGNDPRIPVWGELYDNAVQKLQGATDRNKYSGGALSAKPDNVI